jgi:Family of unknown function (DUF6131)
MIGIIVVIVGAILALLGMAGHSVGGRRHYYRAMRYGSGCSCPRVTAKTLRDQLKAVRA